MVRAIRCSTCGKNIELQDLDNRDEFTEEFVNSGCDQCDGCSLSDGIPDFLKTPEMLQYEAVFGGEVVEDGLYFIDLETLYLGGEDDY